jgi:glyoxylase-like metal-dependent hydrolase (beta-lactamase superfamily II)
MIFTHGHPDHLWGVVDELDELVLPDATFSLQARNGISAAKMQRADSQAERAALSKRAAQLRGD